MVKVYARDVSRDLLLIDGVLPKQGEFWQIASKQYDSLLKPTGNTPSRELAAAHILSTAARHIIDRRHAYEHPEIATDIFVHTYVIQPTGETSGYFAPFFNDAPDTHDYRLFMHIADTVYRGSDIRQRSLWVALHKRNPLDLAHRRAGLARHRHRLQTFANAALAACYYPETLSALLKGCGHDHPNSDGIQV